MPPLMKEAEEYVLRHKMESNFSFNSSKSHCEYLICMKIRILLLMLLYAEMIFSNNIQVTNVRLAAQNTTDHFAMVEFNITWENSWRLVGGPGNWDAAWIFVKYRIGAGPWIHAWLNNTGHISCSGTTIANGLLNPSSAFHPTTNPALGVFFYRDGPGTGNMICNNVQLRWNYGANGLSDDVQVDLKVLAIEQVYISAGSFKVGSGGNEQGACYTYPTTTNVYEITSESAINVGTSSGNLFYNNTSGQSGDQSGPIPAAFPKGYAAFYMMKYELSQQAYVEFLNTLTRQQQITRVRSNISGSSVTNTFVMSVTMAPSYRNGIRCRSTIPASPAPVEFFCDLNGNSMENETMDGQGIACNWLLWTDLTAYLDWAGLRPMTEFEFEKCARGPLTPVPNEYAWGNNTIYLLTAVTNPGLPNEVPSQSFVNCTGPEYGYPVRCGAFARTANDRTISGAGYYGCLDLSGNLWERGVTFGNGTGRAFTGLHGNGLLTADGKQDVSFWPDVAGAQGAFLRGASFYTQFTENRTSDRIFAVWNVNGNESTGGRGVRSAP